MRLFILSLLAVSSVHSLPYQYRGQLLAYSPARGEFPVYNSLAEGYIRYFDTNGAEQLLRYNYPEPYYGFKRFSYGSEDLINPHLRTGYIPSYAASDYILPETNEIIKARELHFREWCEQRYQALKIEMDRLRAEGKKPSPDMMAQFLPLEKIITATNYATIIELPEVKRAREEHLRIWNEARLKVLQQEAEHLRLNDQRPIEKSTFEAAAPIGETAEQKKAREEHLRIYNEQLLKVKQLEDERKSDKFFVKELTATSQPEFQVFNRLGEQQAIVETPEVMRAKEEHLRLWNEAKLRAEKEGYKYEEKTENRPFKENAKPVITTELKSVIVDPIKTEGYKYEVKSSFPATTYLPSEFKPQDTPEAVKETPEVLRAREEHLKLVNEAKFKATPVLRIVPGIQQPIQAFVPVKPVEELTVLKSSIPYTNLNVQQATQIQETPEVKRAREEHIKLFNEAKLKTEQLSKESETFKLGQVSTYKAKDDAEKFRETERIKDEERIMETERLRDLERTRNEEKIREEERLRDIERIKEDERLMESDRLRLKLEEEKRMEMEKIEDDKRRKLDEIKYEKFEGAQIKTIIPATIPIAQTAANTFVLTPEQQKNPFFLRFANNQQDGAYFISEQKPFSQILPVEASAPIAAAQTFVNPENPFLIRYLTTENRPVLPELQTKFYETVQQQEQHKQPFDIQLKSDFKPTPLENYSESASLTQLEKATREHFRAHEIALEQLRLANYRGPYYKDCN